MLRKIRGFTLIELLIVVAIILILAAIIVPNVAVFISSDSTSEKIEIVDQKKSEPVPQTSNTEKENSENKIETGDNKPL